MPVWYADGMICTGETYKAVVKVTFAKGAALADPSGLFNSSLDGNVRRAIDFREADRVDETAARQSPWAQWTAVLVFLVEAALALGDVPAARRLRPLLAPYSGKQLIAGQFVAVFGPADAYLAALDSLLGDRDSAERLFAAALTQATAFGALTICM